jgi:transposase
VAGPQKKAAHEGMTIVLVDESGFYLLPGRVVTYAPRGQTPRLRWFYTRDHLSVMSGITTAGRLYTRVRDAAFSSADAVAFLRHLLRHIGGKLLVIWDGAPIHHGAVKTFLANGGAHRVHIEPLPPYAPDLNPDEGVWHLLKDVEMRNLCCTDLLHLRHELRLAIMRLRAKPHLIRACFAGAGLTLDS